MQSGADIDIADNAGKTAMAIAAEKGLAAVAKYLDVENKWRRRRALVKVISSVQEAPTANRAMQILQTHDVAREITSWL